MENPIDKDELRCLNCLHWKADGYQLDKSATIDSTTNDAECTRIQDLIEIDLDCIGYGCGGEHVDSIWTNQDFFCAGFEEREVIE